MAAEEKKRKSHPIVIGFLIFVIFASGCAIAYAIIQYNPFALNYAATFAPVTLIPPPTLNKALYDAKLVYIARPLSENIAIEMAAEAAALASSSILASTSILTNTATAIPATSTSTASTTPPLWPVETVYPNYGALLPFNRIVAYYGNFASTQLGVLGEYPPQVMLGMLMGEVAKWQAADPKTPVIPALDYIAVTAQGTPGPDGKYRLRMPASQIEEAITLASQVNGIVILDVQVGQSSVETEVPLLEQFLKMPNVELALDPEFAMKPGDIPSTVIGTLDASDINFAADFLAQLVRENHLPPKILIVHRFTEAMVTDSQGIAPLPEVQIVMDMDGFGSPAQKTKVYQEVITDYPVQFTGIKLFYKNDIVPPSPGLMTDNQVLNLTPEPNFIQYQ